MMRKGRKMKADAIVYTSKTGFTEKYALLLAEKTGLPVYTLKKSGILPKTARVIYLGWIMASHVSGYERAAGSFILSAVCGVGLGETGTKVDEIRAASKIPDNIPLFTLKGGYCAAKQKGINKLIMKGLAKGLSGKENRTPDEEEMLRLITNDGDYVSEDNLSEILSAIERE